MSMRPALGISVGDDENEMPDEAPERPHGLPGSSNDGGQGGSDGNARPGGGKGGKRKGFGLALETQKAPGSPTHGGSQTSSNAMSTTNANGI